MCKTQNLVSIHSPQEHRQVAREYIMVRGTEVTLTITGILGASIIS